MKMSMKKLLFVSVIGFWSLSASANNQLGVEGGVNLSNISTGPTSSTTSSLTKLDIAAFYDWKLMDWLYFAPGIGYQGRGASASGVTASADWIEVPLLAKAKFATGSIVTPIILTGLVPAFKIGENTSPSFYSSFDLGFTFGGGAEFEVSPGVTVGATVRYTLGLLNTLNSAYTGSGSSVKNNGLQILASLGFAM